MAGKAGPARRNDRATAAQREPSPHVKQKQDRRRGAEHLTVGALTPGRSVPQMGDIGRRCAGHVSKIERCWIYRNTVV